MVTFQQLGQAFFVAPHRMHEEVYWLTAPPPFHSQSNSLRVFSITTFRSRTVGNILLLRSLV